MIYTPFVKAKQNEIIALGSLPIEISSQLCPFFDYPLKGGLSDANILAGDMLKKAQSFQRHLGSFSEFYLDVLDLDDSLRPGGHHPYAYLLDAFTDLPVIPVVGTDRSQDHLDAVLSEKESGRLASRVVAVRFQPDDFQHFGAIQGDLEDSLDPIFALFDEIDVVFDLRVCSNYDPVLTAENISSFASQFYQRYGARRLIVAGSSIPASISELIETDSVITITRSEITIFRLLQQGAIPNGFIFGDYTIVSPNYSDADLSPAVMQSVITGKLAYSYDDKHYIVRGSRLRTAPGQYQQLAEDVCSQEFYRGSHYSEGDKFLEERSLGMGGARPHTVIKPSIVAHITYTVLDYPI